MDETVVRVKTWLIGPLQDPQGEKQPLGRHNFAELVQSHRETEQKGRLLLQALQSLRPFRLGTQRTRKRDDRSGRPAPAQLILHLSGPVAGLRDVLAGRSGDFHQERFGPRPLCQQQVRYGQHQSRDPVVGSGLRETFRPR